MKKLSYLLFVVLFISCSEWQDEGHFRNHLRDLHPYSELIEIDYGTGWHYRVNDTINNEIWIYSSSRPKRTLKGYCVTCDSAYVPNNNCNCPDYIHKSEIEYQYEQLIRPIVVEAAGFQGMVLKDSIGTVFVITDDKALHEVLQYSYNVGDTIR